MPGDRGRLLVFKIRPSDLKIPMNALTDVLVREESSSVTP